MGIDGQGKLANIRGSVELRDGVLTKLDVSLGASKIPFRIPGTLDLDISAAVRILKGSEHATLDMSGKVTIDNGKISMYRVNMKITFVLEE